MRFRHGMVVGKFYPPHAGHHLLIDTAAAACDRLTVVVAPSTVETIPLELRLEWLREAHPAHVRFVGVYDDNPVDYDDPEIWDAHCAIFRAAVGDSPVDVVFSSERYGDELARRFDARHVCVDLSRRSVPVSGTAVRADPAGHWDFLSPPVRAYYTRRVVVVGAESTGTTTVAVALAERLRERGGVWARTLWVPEYGRELTELKLSERQKSEPDAEVSDVEWTRADFVTVARAQNAAEDAAARAGSPVLVCDTDSRATAVWEERYLGSASPEVLAEARDPHLYLLTDHSDVPFVDDGLRDGEHIRPWMTGRFRAVLAATGVPTVELRGPLVDRIARAEAAVDALLQTPGGNV